MNNGSRNSDALLLPAREFCGAVSASVPEPHLFEGEERHGPRFRGRGAVEQQGEFNVFNGREDG